jgi:hypothetical protein
MPSRTQIFQQLPWTGGVNTSVDSGVIPPQDLVQAENIVFTTSGIRRKREGRSYFDDAIPAVTHRESSGTTRTLTFASSINDAAVNEILIAGEGINVTTTTTSGNEYDYYRIAPGTVASIASSTSITYTGSGSLTEGSTATSTCTVSRAYPVVKLVDYWRWTGSVLSQRVVGITSQPLMFYWDSTGNRLPIAKDGAATARAGTALKVDAVVFNEVLIVAQSRTGNTPIKYKPVPTGTGVGDDNDWVNLGGSPPDFSICSIHLNRVWTNDKTNKDRLHYSATANAEKWQGADDSGALDIRPGDGDPSGITGIFPFKGRLFVAKQKRFYQVVGDSPENFQVLDVSSGIGVVNQAAVASIDQDDVLFMSERGIHSVGTTASYGDFAGQYLSNKIQPSFDGWTKARLEYSQALYIPFLSSVAFSISEDSSSVQDKIWLFNTLNKEWYEWPDIQATAMCVVNVNSKPTLYMATSGGRIVTAQNSTYEDYETDAINYNIKSGTIYPDNSPMTLKAFKRITIFFRPYASYSFTVKAKIDLYAEQQLTFSGTSSGDVLGTTFILGQSLLGTSTRFSAYTLPIDGIGNGITLEILQTGIAEQGDIYGYAIEWEPVGIPQETLS